MVSASAWAGRVERVIVAYLRLHCRQYPATAQSVRHRVLSFKNRFCLTRKNSILAKGRLRPPIL